MCPAKNRECTAHWSDDHSPVGATTRGGWQPIVCSPSHDCHWHACAPRSRVTFLQPTPKPINRRGHANVCPKMHTTQLVKMVCQADTSVASQCCCSADGHGSHAAIAASGDVQLLQATCMLQHPMIVAGTVSLPGRHACSPTACHMMAIQPACLYAIHSTCTAQRVHQASHNVGCAVHNDQRRSVHSNQCVRCTCKDDVNMNERKAMRWQPAAHGLVATSDMQGFSQPMPKLPPPAAALISSTHVCATASNTFHPVKRAEQYQGLQHFNQAPARAGRSNMPCHPHSAPCCGVCATKQCNMLASILHTFPAPPHLANSSVLHHRTEQPEQTAQTLKSVTSNTLSGISSIIALLFELQPSGPCQGDLDPHACVACVTTHLVRVSKGQAEGTCAQQRQQHVTRTCLATRMGKHTRQSLAAPTSTQHATSMVSCETVSDALVGCATSRCIDGVPNNSCFAFETRGALCAGNCEGSRQ